MIRTILLCVSIILSGICYSQNGYIALKKRNKTVRMYFKDNPITFRMQNGEWITGTVTKVEDSSFTFTQEIIRYYPIGVDTFRIYGYRFYPSEIMALPSKRQQFVYRNDRVFIVPGNEKFMWLRNGLIFQAGGGGYFVENVVNDLANHEPPFAKGKIGGLAIAAGVFIVGSIMHLTFDPSISLGNKFTLQLVSY